jgi:hypothetical protein
MSTRAKPTSIRINLRFGANTDARLHKSLKSLPAYRRAKFVRSLMNDGWRLRNGELGSAAVAMNPPTLHTPRLIDTDEPLLGDPFSESMNALLGRTVT